MFEVEATRFSSTRIHFTCDGCGKTDWPLLRIVGYPTEEAWELEEAGEAVIKGCIVDPTDMHDYECPHCERGTDVPEGGGIDD